MHSCSRKGLFFCALSAVALASAAHGESLNRLPSNAAQAGVEKGGIPTKAERKLPQASNSAASETTWEIFGFTEGSDAGAAGSREIYVESVLWTGRNIAGLATSTGFVYSPIDKTAIWLGFDTSLEQSDTQTFQSTLQGAGPSGGIKYQVFGRGRTPVGFAAQWSFSWLAAKGDEQPQGIFSQEYRLLADWQFAPAWFAAVNLALAPEVDSYKNAPTEYTHTVEFSTAVTKRVSEKYFIGVELRHLARYQSAFAALQEEAVYIGPSILARYVSGYVGLAWSARVAESGATPSSFGAHQLRFKAGLDF